MKVADGENMPSVKTGGVFLTARIKTRIRHIKLISPFYLFERKKKFFSYIDLKISICFIHRTDGFI